MTHESLVGPKSLCKKPWLPAPRITAFSNHGHSACRLGATPVPLAWVFGSRITRHETRITAFSNHRLVSSPAISHDFPAFPTISRPPRGGCKSNVSARSSVLGRPRRRTLLRIPWRIRQAWRDASSRSGRWPGLRDRASLVAELKGRCGKIPSLHFSPRGEAKCVRGPSGRGASRLARAGVLEPYVEHGKQTQRSPGARIACFDRRVVRNAGWLLACVSHRVLRPAVGEKCRVRPL